VKSTNREAFHYGNVGTPATLTVGKAHILSTPRPQSVFLVYGNRPRVKDIQNSSQNCITSAFKEGQIGRRRTVKGRKAAGTAEGDNLKN
jgi:hypothetical protein